MSKNVNVATSVPVTTPTPPPPQLPHVPEKTPVKTAQKPSPTIPWGKKLPPKPVPGALDRVQAIAADRGYSKAEIKALVTLLRRESGIQQNNVNPTSHACGLFQRLPCPWKITVEDGHWVVHASIETQMENGLAYIERRYGTCAKALSEQLRKGWY